MKRNDVMILLALLAVGAILYFVSGRGLPGRTGAGDGAKLTIAVPGRETQTVPLTESRELVIEQENGERNVVVIFPGGFYMKESTCRNQDCVGQGEVTLDNMGKRLLYNQVICLPNRVVLELQSGADEPAETLEITP